MGINFNGTNITGVEYNETNLDKVIFNGTTVFEGGSPQTVALWVRVESLPSEADWQGTQYLLHCSQYGRLIHSNQVYTPSVSPSNIITSVGTYYGWEEEDLGIYKNYNWTGAYSDGLRKLMVGSNYLFAGAIKNSTNIDSTKYTVIKDIKNNSVYGYPSTLTSWNGYLTITSANSYWLNNSTQSIINGYRVQMYKRIVVPV